MLLWGMLPGCWRRDPRLAVEQADEILKAVPGHPYARLILGTAHRHAGQTTAALESSSHSRVEQPGSPAVHIELAIALSEAGRATEAISAVRRALQLKPNSVDAWRVLAEQLDLIGDADGADGARAAQIKAATTDPRLLEAAAALVANDLPVAEALLRTHLKAFPTDVAALRMLAEVAGRLQAIRRRTGVARTMPGACTELRRGSPQLCRGAQPRRESGGGFAACRATAGQRAPQSGLIGISRPRSSRMQAITASRPKSMRRCSKTFRSSPRFG